PAFSMQVKVPVPPAAMVLHVQFAGGVNDTNVVFAGIVSLNVALVSVPGPLFVSDCVYVILLPCVTGFGVAAVKTARSACPADATTVVAVASLFVAFASGVMEDTVAGAVMTVPAAVPEITFSTTENVALPPTASDAMVQVMVPVPPARGNG